MSEEQLYLPGLEPVKTRGPGRIRVTVTVRSLDGDVKVKSKTETFRPTEEWKADPVVVMEWIKIALRGEG